MNNTRKALPCEVIKDLLPSFIDGITSEATNKLIAEHLETCDECRAAYEAMVRPELETVAKTAVPDAGGVRYLKKIKRRHKAVTLSVVAGLLAIFVVAYYFLAARIYPFPVDTMRVMERYQLDDGSILVKVRIDGNLIGLDGYAFQGIGADENGNPMPADSDNFPQYEYQLGYRMITKFSQHDKPKDGYIYFQIPYELLRNENLEAIYFRGFGGTERLLLWQVGDVIPSPKAEQLAQLEKEVLPIRAGFSMGYE